MPTEKPAVMKLSSTEETNMGENTHTKTEIIPSTMETSLTETDANHVLIEVRGGSGGTGDPTPQINSQNDLFTSKSSGCEATENIVVNSGDDLFTMGSDIFSKIPEEQQEGTTSQHSTIVIADSEDEQKAQKGKLSGSKSTKSSKSNTASLKVKKTDRKLKRLTKATSFCSFDTESYQSIDDAWRGEHIESEDIN